MSVCLSVFADEIWVESTKRRDATLQLIRGESITSVVRLMTVSVALLPSLLLPPPSPFHPLVVVGVKYTSSQTIWQAF